MNINGLAVQGYFEGQPYSSGLATCGLGILNRFTNCQVQEENHKQFLTELFDTVKWSCGAHDHGSLVFALSSIQIQNRTGFLKYICEHEDTKCMHYYTNDAHGPNMVFICVIHRNQEATKPKKLRQLMKVFEKTEFKYGQWRMKDAE